MKAAQIQTDTPKAYEKLKKWMHYESMDLLEFEMYWILKNPRDLFDFFDEQKIFINAENIGSDEKPHFRSALKYTKNEIRYVWTNPKGVKTRKEAEKVAYKNAFKILETQCK